MAENTGESTYIALTAQIVSAYVGNNSVPSAEIANLIGQVHAALKRVSGGQMSTPAEPVKPAVPVKRSISSDYIVCLEDGKKFKSLKRHLRTPVQHDAGAISRQMGTAAGLSDGRAQLCGCPLAACQADGARPAAPPPQIARLGVGVFRCAPGATAVLSLKQQHQRAPHALPSGCAPPSNESRSNAAA